MFNSDTIPSNPEPLVYEVHCGVSFFNAAKEYGFVEVSKDKADAHVNLKTIRNLRIYYLDEGQNLSLKIIEYGCQP